MATIRLFIQMAGKWLAHGVHFSRYDRLVRAGSRQESTMPRTMSRNEVQNETVCDPPIEWANCRLVLREWEDTGRIPERFVDSLVQFGLVVLAEAMGGLRADDRMHLICRRVDLAEAILVSLDRRGRALSVRTSKKSSRRR
jgi:hypothetical protein